MPNRLKPSPVEALQQQRIDALVDAMSQLLEDMGADGHTVCEMAKAQARLAFEPFRHPIDVPDYTLEQAQAVMDGFR